MVMVMRFDVISVRMMISVISVISVIVVIVIVVWMWMWMIVGVRMRMIVAVIVVSVSVRLDRAVGVATGTVRVAVPPFAAATGIHHETEPKSGDQQSTCHAQPTEHHLASQCRRNSEGQPKRKHATGVCGGDGRSDHDSVTDRTLPTGNVGGHHGLAMTG
jgi:hypothetical protein